LPWPRSGRKSPATTGSSSSPPVEIRRVAFRSAVQMLVRPRGHRCAVSAGAAWRGPCADHGRNDATSDHPPAGRLRRCSPRQRPVCHLRGRRRGGDVAAGLSRRACGRRRACATMAQPTSASRVGRSCGACHARAALPGAHRRPAREMSMATSRWSGRLRRPCRREGQQLRRRSLRSRPRTGRLEGDEPDLLVEDDRLSRAVSRGRAAASGCSMT